VIILPVEIKQVRSSLLHKQLKNSGVQWKWKRAFKKNKNSHDSKIVVVTIETDMSPAPNNLYLSQRVFNLKPNQLRIQGLTIVDEGAGKADNLVYHRIVNAKFQ
jgi:hypothetical protein